MTATLPREALTDAPAPEERRTSLALIAGPAVALLTALVARTLLFTDIWLDEGYTMAAVRRPWTSISGEHGTMGLYYALVSVWGQVSEQHWWIRGLSLLFTVGALVAFAALLRRQWGDAVARWGALLAAASYLVVGLAGEARSYGLVALLVVGGWTALDRVIEQPDDARWWRLYWLCCALVPLSHGVAVLQVGAQMLAVLLARPDRRIVVRALVGQAIAAVTFAGLWLYGISKEGNWLPALDLDGVTDVLESLTTPQPILALAMIGVAAFGAVRCIRSAGASHDPLERFRNLIWVLWGLGTPILILGASLARPIQAPRYMAATAFGLAGLWAVGLRQRPGSTRLPYELILVLAVLLPAGISGGSAEAPTWSAAATAVRAELEPDDAFLFPSADTRLPFEAAWIDEPDAPTAPVIGVEGSLGDLRRFSLGLDSEGLAEKAAQHRGRIWIVSQPMSGIPDPLPTLLAQPIIEANFTTSEPTVLDGHITIVLLTPR